LIIIELHRALALGDFYISTVYKHNLCVVGVEWARSTALREVKPPYRLQIDVVANNCFFTAEKSDSFEEGSLYIGIADKAVSGSFGFRWM